MTNPLASTGHMLVFLMAVVLLQGCAGSNILNSDAAQETTGEMGQINRSSPADVYVKLASEYLREGNYQAALTNGKKAVDRDSNNSNAHLVLALVYESLSEDGLAEKHYKRALKVDSKNSYALNAYGSLLCGQGHYDNAISQFNKAVANPLYETPWVALTNAGICARTDGNLSQAETYLRQALQINKKYNPALLQMARVSYDNGRYLQTRAYLERYKETGKPTAESLWLGIKAERQLGDVDQASSYEMLLRDRFPDSRQVQNLDSEP